MKFFVVLEAGTSCDKIQKALDDPETDVVYVEPGAYDWSGLHIPSNKRLIGLAKSR